MRKLIVLGMVGVALVFAACGDDDDQEAKEPGQSSKGQVETTTTKAATPGVTRTELGRGTAANDYQTAGTKGTDVVMQSITIDPGSATGWHTHPGLETAIIKSGTLTLFDSGNPSCAAQTFTAGQVFPGTEHPHLARNLGNVPIEIVSTYYNVPAGGPVASPAPEPANCAGK